jgi:hypothetical protein
MVNSPATANEPLSSEDRELTADDARLLFRDLAGALSLDNPISRRDFADLTQQMLYIIEAHHSNELRMADEVFRWRREFTGNYSEQYFELRNHVGEALGTGESELKQRINMGLNMLYQQFKQLHGELTSMLHPSRYQITAFKRGTPQAFSGLTLMSVREGKHGTINLHINDTSAD